jgi:hypothetical protein
MNTSNTSQVDPPIPEAASTAWVRQFREEVMRLANGQADVLQVADWAWEAYITKWQRDPIEVAREELEHGTPPIPD